MTLPLHEVVLNNDGMATPRARGHTTWVVASQDCDLHGCDPESNEAILELRPVFEGQPQQWGIRSRRFRLDNDRYVDADVARCHVSPAVLGMAAHAREPLLNEATLRFFKTWLGLRYDRPAWPDDLLNLGRVIAAKTKKANALGIHDKVRDVLLQCNENTDPPTFSLFAVVMEAGAEDEVRRWLSDIALGVPTGLGIAGTIEAATADETPLSLVEESYAVDTRSLTYRDSEARAP